MIVSKTLTPSRHKEYSELEEECESLRVEITSLRADFERLKKKMWNRNFGLMKQN